FGREGGREGMWEYLVSGHRSQVTGEESKRPADASLALSRGPETGDRGPAPAIDRTPKLFIAGKQARPDQSYTRRIVSPSGEVVGEAPEGNRKDIRNAVEAAHAAATGWARSTGHNRGQILYYVAENLSARAKEFASRIDEMIECGKRTAKREVETSIEGLFTYAAWADKYDGAVHSVPIRGVSIAMNEAIGVIGIACPDEFPLLGLVSLVGPAMATGNTTIVIPSQHHPLAATDFYSVLET